MLIAPPPDALTVGLEWIGVVVGAAAIARVVTLVVRPLVDGDARCPRNDRLIEAGFVACAMVAWWWEMHAVGRLSPPSAGGMVVARHDIAIRHAAHLVLAGLLVAAAWVDLRYRVIPDVITMTGMGSPQTGSFADAVARLSASRMTCAGASAPCQMRN